MSQLYLSTSDTCIQENNSILFCLATPSVCSCLVQLLSIRVIRDPARTLVALMK